MSAQCQRWFRHGKLTGQGLFKCTRRAAKNPTIINDKPVYLCNYCRKWALEYPEEAKKGILCVSTS